MFNQFNPYNPVVDIDRRIEDLQRFKASYQTPQQPVNNIINTQAPQQVPQDLITMRVLNENEDVSNLYVNNKTLFINDKNLVIKGVDGKIEKYDIKKTYPIDPKDQRINELEKEIMNLKGMIANEYSKPNESTCNVPESNVNANVNDESTAKTNCKSVSKKA